MDSPQHQLPEIPLRSTVESLLNRIYTEKQSLPIRQDTRQRLASVTEDEAVRLLQYVANKTVKYSLDGYVQCLIDSASFVSPSRRCGGSPSHSHSPLREQNRPIESPRGSPDAQISRSPQRALAPSTTALDRTIGARQSPELEALGELEFRKAFLILNYIGCNSLEDVVSSEWIRRLKDLSIDEFESHIWSTLGQKYAQPEDRRRSLEWDFGRTHHYYCHVYQDGSCRFKGPFLEKATTHLHRVLGGENVLTVKFANETDNRNSAINHSHCHAVYKRIAKEGISVGLRRYRFFVFKDGGKEERMKNPTTSSVKCYFIRSESRAAADAGRGYIPSGKLINEARLFFMHVHTLPNMSAYMVRFSLILSKTRNLPVDLQDVKVEDIDDIYCYDEDGKQCVDGNGKDSIHSDGTGYISEDLASLCPKVFKGNSIDGDAIQKFPQCAEPDGNTHDLHTLGSRGQEPPLLIQFRLFHNGRAIKGTLLLNKMLPCRTIQIRPSMVKVDSDPNLSSYGTTNALEVVNTSNRPRQAKLSRNLIALLSHGGIPDGFFKDILFDALEEAKGVFYNKRAALKISINKGDMDDFGAARMVLAGIPLDEPYLQHRLSILVETQKNDLKSGRLPVTESYYLMGTVDPTGALEKDEVCIVLHSGQISGQVLVYRNPGLHFGDVHICKATYVKALEDIIGNAKYAIFFPQKGPRSLADEIAGGDFDGDMYFVSRNPELLRYFKPSEPWVPRSSSPGSSSGKRPSELSTEELEEEAFEQFLKTRFHQSKTIGMAADSWLAIMDRFLSHGDNWPDEKDRMKSNILRLIDIYYDALDATKKGIKVELPEELRARVYPHFMERDRGRSFKSTSILGQLYDLVMDHKNPDFPLTRIRKIPFFEDNVSATYLSKWKKLYERYREDMTEALKFEGDGKNEAANEVVQRYKEELYGAAEYEENERSWLELREEGLAVYNVTYDYAMETGSVEKCGFAWKVAGPVLCRAYLEKQGERSLLLSTSSSVFKELCG